MITSSLTTTALAKEDAELVESTQAALARVEMLIGKADASAAGGAEPSQWSGQWTSWLQSRTTARTPARWAEDFSNLRDAVRELRLPRA
ncbi:hypothetical protein ACIQWA_20920 [Kitasatospora sp. NPDC098652]|uniref:hypothetical protein n=1 Tax=Kitasatospora sp. NPDC098652 TaxID=3364095 RepID=UPI00382A9489